MNSDLSESIKNLTEKEISLSSVSSILNLSEFEVLGVLRELRQEGTNIGIQKKDDDIYLFNHGERENNKDNRYQFYTDESNEFKFVAIADTRLGSKYQQLTGVWKK